MGGIWFVDLNQCVGRWEGSVLLVQSPSYFTPFALTSTYLQELSHPVQPERFHTLYGVLFASTDEAGRGGDLYRNNHATFYLGRADDP